MRSEFRYTAARLNKDKFTKGPLAPTFMAFLSRLTAAETEEESLLMGQEESNAEVAFIDYELDQVVDQVTGATGSRRGPGLYRELFGNKRVSEFKRPMLNDQLDAMLNWPEVLASRTDPILVRVAQALSQLIPRAVAAQASKSATRARLLTFRETGTRAQAIGEFNALRKSTFGELSKLQNQHKMGTSWAESFFRQSNGSQELTVPELERRLAANGEEQMYLQALHQELVAKQEAAEEAAQQAAERARQAEIASKRDYLARLTAELQELEGES